jgi:hypothetical protein
VFDSDGELIEPHLHDGLLTGIVVESHDDVDTLVIHCTDGDRKRQLVLRFANLSRLRVDNFREGNVIFDLQEIDGAAMPDGDLDDLVGREGKGKYTFLSMSTSYGCDLLASFETARRLSTYETVGA